MPIQKRMPRIFGADDRIVCQTCGEVMTVTRRSPDADYGSRYERQTLTCRTCRWQVERTVDADGAVIDTSP
jgi:hypothetical protein